MMDELNVNGKEFMSQDKIIDACLKVVLNYHAYSGDIIPSVNEIECVDYLSELVEELFGAAARDEFQSIYTKMRFIDRHWDL